MYPIVEQIGRAIMYHPANVKEYTTPFFSASYSVQQTGS